MSSNAVTCPDCGAEEGAMHESNCPWMLSQMRHRTSGNICGICLMPALACQCAGAQASPRATEVPLGTQSEPRRLSVSIESIRHSYQRYDTCGDWHRWPNIDCLYVKVSQLPDRREMWLVAIHELIEAALCEVAGIGQDEVDKFDKGFSDRDTEHEPGDDIRAPYYRQHQLATGIERLLAAEMGVDWRAYEQHIRDLDHLDRDIKSSQPLIDDDIPF